MARVPFEDLPVGACFAFDADAARATRRKVDARRTIILPDGRRPLIVESVEMRVSPKACPTNFGRRRRRKRSR